MSTIQPLRPQQKVAEGDGSIHRDFFRWLAMLAARIGLTMNGAVLLRNVTLTVGVENLVPHGLGVSFDTWYPADLQAAVQIYRYTASTADLTVYLPLLTTATTTCDIVVVPV